MTEQPFATATDLDSRSSDKGAALAQASALVRGLVGWHVFPVRQETFVVHGSGADTVLLPTMRLVDVITVLDDGRPVGVEWSTAGYVRRRGRFTDKLRGVQVTATHGYDTEPEDLADVVMALAERILEDPTSSHTSERSGDYSVGYGDLSNQHLAVLARYTLREAA